MRWLNESPDADRIRAHTYNRGRGYCNRLPKPEPRSPGLHARCHVEWLCGYRTHITQSCDDRTSRCMGKKRLDGLAQRDNWRRGCFAGGIQRATTAIGVPTSSPSRLDCSASGLGACRHELPSIQAALGRTIQAAVGRTIQAALERTTPLPWSLAKGPIRTSSRRQSNCP